MLHRGKEAHVEEESANLVFDIDHWANTNMTLGADHSDEKITLYDHTVDGNSIELANYKEARRMSIGYYEK